MRLPPLRHAALLASVGLLLALHGPADARDGESCENPPQLRFSLVPVNDAARDLRLHRPLFERIEALTGRPVVAVRPTSYASVVEGLLSGDLDIAKLGPASYVQAKRADPRIAAFATQEKRGGVFQITGPYYHAVLAVLKKSDLADLAHLKGKRLALTDPGSTSGALLPREEFAPVIGMPLEQYFGAIAYSGGHGKSLAALLKGDVDAAFIASTQLEDALQRKLIEATDIRTLWTSKSIPFDPFVMRGQLCESLRANIRRAFLEDDASLRPLLDELEATRFAPVDDRPYEAIRRVVEKAL